MAFAWLLLKMCIRDRDWGEDEDGCGEGGCDCCSHGCHHDDDEDDDM